MSKHTPGPWRMKESPQKREFSHFVEAGTEAGSYFIAAVANGTGPDDENAQLIAAAPELLAACQAAMQVLDDIAPDYSHTAEQVRAAISKRPFRCNWCLE